MSRTINFGDIISAYGPDNTSLLKICGQNNVILWQTLPEIVERSDSFFLLEGLNIGTGYSGEGNLYRKWKCIYGTFICPYRWGDTESREVYYPSTIYRLSSYHTDNNSLRKPIIRSLEGYYGFTSVNGHTTGFSTLWPYYNINTYSTSIADRTRNNVPVGLWQFVRFKNTQGIYLYSTVYKQIVSNTSKYHTWYYTNDINYGFDWTNHLDADVFSSSGYTTESLYFNNPWNDTFYNYENWKYKLIRSKPRSKVAIYTDDNWDTIFNYLDYTEEGVSNLFTLHIIKNESGVYNNTVSVTDNNTFDFNHFVIHYGVSINSDNKIIWCPAITATHVVQANSYSESVERLHPRYLTE